MSLWDVAARRVTGSLDVTRTNTAPAGAAADVVPFNAVNGIVFSADGRSLIASRIPEDERIEIWNVRDRTLAHEVLRVGGQALAVKPGGRVLATDHGQLLDLQTGQVTRRTLTPDATTALAFSPDGKYLAAGDEAGQVTVWDGAARRSLGGLPPTAVGDGRAARRVSALAFSPDGRTLAAAGKDGTLRLWDTGSASALGSPSPQREVRCCPLPSAATARSSTRPRNTYRCRPTPWPRSRSPPRCAGAQERPCPPIRGGPWSMASLPGASVLDRPAGCGLPHAWHGRCSIWSALGEGRRSSAATVAAGPAAARPA